MPRQIRARRKTNDVDTKKLDAAFSSAVFARDGRRCRMEKWSGGKWVECGSKGSPCNPLDPSHIYARDNCGTLKYDKIVGIASCRDCHERYEGKLRDKISVRVPLYREAAAYRAVTIAVTSFHVPRRKPPARPERAA